SREVQPTDSLHNLGTLSDLLQARIVVDALLARAHPESPSAKESCHAVEPGVHESNRSTPTARTHGYHRCRGEPMEEARPGGPGPGIADPRSSHRGSAHRRARAGESS